MWYWTVRYFVLYSVFKVPSNLSISKKNAANHGTWHFTDYLSLASIVYWNNCPTSMT